MIRGFDHYTLDGVRAFQSKPLLQDLMLVVLLKLICQQLRTFGRGRGGKERGMEGNER